MLRGVVDQCCTSGATRVILLLDMDFTDFAATLEGEAPPESLTLLLRALWLDRKGDFAGAHAIAQDVHTEDGARVHAYLHRKEGDLPNAQYWYGKAHCQAARGSLEAEWEGLVRRLLAAASQELSPAPRGRTRNPRAGAP